MVFAVFFAGVVAQKHFAERQSITRAQRWGGGRSPLAGFEKCALAAQGLTSAGSRKKAVLALQP
jgi:hypothetical protein